MIEQTTHKLNETTFDISHSICEVCLDDGKCLNNETHVDYDKNNEDFFGTDYLDCVDYLEKKNNTEGQFMKRYLKKLQK